MSLRAGYSLVFFSSSESLRSSGDGEGDLFLAPGGPRIFLAPGGPLDLLFVVTELMTLVELYSLPLVSSIRFGVEVLK